MLVIFEKQQVDVNFYCIYKHGAKDGYQTEDGMWKIENDQVICESQNYPISANNTYKFDVYKFGSEYIQSDRDPWRSSEKCLVL